MKVNMDQKHISRDEIRRFVKFAESADLAKSADRDDLKRMADGLATTLNFFDNRMRKEMAAFKRIEAAYIAIVERGNAVVREAEKAKRTRASNGQSRR